MAQENKDITKELLDHNIKPSFQRMSVYKYLLNNRDHPTVDQIYIHLQDELPTLSKATVYNTLKLFVKENLVRVITIEGNEIRYDISTKDHGHFKCIKCSEIFNFDVNSDDLKSHDLEGFKILSKNVYFKGICSRCQ